MSDSLSEYRQRNKFVYVLYEVIGTCFLTLAAFVGHYPPALIVASFMAWELSAAHFNVGLTFAEIVMVGDKSVCGMGVLIVILGQCIGFAASFGIMAALTTILEFEVMGDTVRSILPLPSFIGQICPMAT